MIEKFFIGFIIGSMFLFGSPKIGAEINRSPAGWYEARK